MSKIIIGGSDAGFFSIFRGTVGTFLVSELNSLSPIVVWKNTLYNDDPSDNAWEYYFKQTCEYNEEDLKKHRHVNHMILPREYKSRIDMNRLINKYVKVNDDIEYEVLEIMHELGNKPLGVHIRMTDKNNCTSHGEPESGLPVSLELYEKHIDNNLQKHDSKIFLATDDEEVIKRMKRRYGDRIFYTSAIRSTGNKSIHHNLVGNNKQKGRDVLKDCLVLSKCRHIIKGISNVALCAMFWNINLTCENLNSIYNEDKREDFVNE